jgi:hypothetical protein
MSGFTTNKDSEFCQLDLNDKFRTIRPFLKTGCIGLGKAMSFATYSRGESHPMLVAWCYARCS